MSVAREMPRYKCHKLVWALKIAAIDHLPNPDTTGTSASSSYGAVLTPAESGYAPFEVSSDYMNKHQPELGGYYVVYDDGYQSYSPAKAFEGGYELVSSVTSLARHPLFSGGPPQLAAQAAEFERAVRGPQAADLSTEQAIVAAGATKGPRVTPADLEDNIVHTEIVKHVSVTGQVLRWAVITARNGFAVVGKPSCAVSSENDNAEIGKQVAIANTKEEMWPLMGYALRTELAAVPADFQGRVRQEHADLEARLSKLTSFLSTDTFHALDREEQNRLTAQQAAMCDYSNVLSERIQAFGEPRA